MFRMSNPAMLGAGTDMSKAMSNIWLDDRTPLEDRTLMGFPEWGFGDKEETEPMSYFNHSHVSPF